ncbi:MAG: hypothetical protein KHZ54_12455 [Erysipelotrichaceae bacterium]|nr:hypothetical protein [Erysipelotrichaceae bacterium]
MANRISRDARKLILDDLILIGSCSGGQYVAEFAKRVFPDVENMTYQQGAYTVPVINDISRHMDVFSEDWDFTYLFDTVLDLLNVPDDKFIYFCEEYVNPVFRRRRLDENEERIDVTQECIDAINRGLSDIGMSLQPAGQTAGRTKYKARPIATGANEPIKNIIFAAKFKPDIVLDDALANDIKVVNANGALIYDQGIPADGISWKMLAEWYGLLEIDNTEKQMAHLFYDCLDSEPERIFYKAYISYLKKHTKNIPALLPQVYMYYDPKTKAQRDWQIFEHQKMDFMMIISPSQRVVFEIDGSQHYAEDDIAPGSQYKHYASPSRYAEMMKAHREMSLAGYDVYRFGGKELWVNGSTTEEMIIENISTFFDKLFDKYFVER